MQPMLKITMIFSALILFFVIEHSEASANTGCRPAVKVFTIQRAGYDIAAAGATTSEIQYTIRNDGAETCQSLRIVFCSASSTQTSGQEAINYILRQQNSSNLINEYPGGLCPDQLHNSISEARTIPNLAPGASETSFSRFEVAIPPSQFVNAGEYESGDLRMAVYQSSGQLADSKSTRARTGVLPFCEIPVGPQHVSSSNADFTPAGGISGGAINLTRAIDRSRATLKIAHMTLRFKDSRCNYKASLSLKSANGGMIIPGANSTSTSFLQKINYRAIAQFCGALTIVETATKGTEASTRTCSHFGNNRPDMLLTVQTRRSTLPLLAGQYEDVLTIQIGSPL